MRPAKRWGIATALFVLAAVAAVIWQPWKAGEDAPRFRLGKIERGPLTAAATASGTLAARVTVQVGSQVSGQIVALQADFNTPVRQGQVIARLDPEPFETRVAQAEADLRAAESSAEVSRGNLAARRAEFAKSRIALDDARRNLERKQGLQAKGFISPAELDAAQAGFDTAREQLALSQAEEGVTAAQVKSALAVIAQRQAALQQAQVELAHTVIRSPVDGTVISRNVDVGQTVAASLQAPVLFTIAQDLAEMELNIAVDEADVGRVQVGQKVRFSVDAFPGERFSGTVSQIRKAAQTSSNVVTYSVMAAVPNPDQKLLPGMTANARIVTEERKDALKVPNEGLRFRPLQPDGTPLKLEVKAREEGPGIPGRVWILGPDAQPAPVSLRLGVSDGKTTEILKGEIQEGSTFILGYEEGSEPKASRSTRPFGMGL